MIARTPGPWMPSPLKASERKGRNIVLASDYAMMKLAFEDQLARLARERDEAVELLRHLDVVLAVTHPMAADLSDGWLPKDSPAGRIESGARMIASRLDDNRMIIRAFLSRLDAKGGA